MISLGLSQLPPVETRESYTDTILEAFLASAAGNTSVRAALSVSAVEEAAGFIARSLATAECEPAIPCVSPAFLENCGRRLIRNGNAVYDVQVTNGRIALVQAVSFDVYGDGNPSTWRYRLQVTGPSSTYSVTRPATAVVHVRYATDPSRPHVGLGPLAWASQSGGLLSAVERSLTDESGGPIGAIVPLPEGVDKPQATEYQSLFGKLRGRLALPVTVAGGGGNRAGAPQRDWDPRRVGPDPPEAMVKLRAQVRESILASCGVQPALMAKDAQATALREAYRQFMHSTAAPLARLIAAELADKLDRPGLRLTFAELHAADIAGKARAWRGLVGKEQTMAPERAGKLVGLE